jgi:hypothetical protein
MMALDKNHKIVFRNLYFFHIFVVEVSFDMGFIMVGVPYGLFIYR